LLHLDLGGLGNPNDLNIEEASWLNWWNLAKNLKKKYKEHILDPIVEQEEEFDKQKY
jgi:hypothetical protein